MTLSREDLLARAAGRQPHLHGDQAGDGADCEHHPGKPCRRIPAHQGVHLCVRCIAFMVDSTVLDDARIRREQ